MLELEDAQARILAAIRPLPLEPVSLRAAAGRILAASVTAPLDLPRFDNSAMDGYAVRSRDLQAAGPGTPVTLSLGGQVSAGETGTGHVVPGTCVRVFTGSILPPGTDAVVMQEDVRRVPDQPGQIQFSDRVKPGENVRFRGEDVRQGSRLLAAGEGLTAGGIGLLAALGLAEVTVHRQPLMGLLATGSELVKAGQPLAPGQIYESNLASLGALLPGAGAVARDYPLVPDDLSLTQAALARAFDQCDVVVTTGGASVGEWDLVKSAFQALGGTVEFWKVAVRPGKPFIFGGWREKFLFGLPGNPVSALVTFLLLVRPALLRLQGARVVELPRHPGTLLEPLANRGDRRHFVRVIVDERGQVRSAGQQASHALSPLAKANGLVDVPPQATFAAGTVVPVLRW